MCFILYGFSPLPDSELHEDRDGLLLPLWSQLLTQQIKLDGGKGARRDGWMDGGGENGSIKEPKWWEGGNGS